MKLPDIKCVINEQGAVKIGSSDEESEYSEQQQFTLSQCLPPIKQTNFPELISKKQTNKNKKLIT